MNGLPVRPYADETLYSLLARNYRYFKRPGAGGFNRRFLGRFLVNYNLTAIPNLAYLAENSGIDPAPLTPLEYYLPFVRKEKKTEILSGLFKPNSKIISKLGLNTSPYKKNSLVYCPLCVNDDVRAHGETYLHRDHYLAGIDICPRHGIYLLEYRDGEHTDILKRPLAIDAEKTEKLIIPATAADKRVASFALRALSGDFRDFSAEDVSRIIYSSFKERGLVNKGGKVLVRKIIWKMRERLGYDFIRRYSLMPDKTRNHVTNLVKGEGRIYPFPALSVICSFFENLDGFFATPVTAERKVKKIKRRDCGRYPADHSKDYSREDLKLEKELKAARESLLKYYPCKKITVSSLFREAGIQRPPQKLKKLERSSAFLKSAVESVREFRVRYTLEAAKRLIQRGEPLTRSNLSKETNDKRHVYNPEIWGEIQEKLQSVPEIGALFLSPKFTRERSFLLSENGLQRDD